MLHQVNCIPILTFAFAMMGWGWACVQIFTLKYLFTWRSTIEEQGETSSFGRHIKVYAIIGAHQWFIQRVGCIKGLLIKRYVSSIFLDPSGFPSPTYSVQENHQNSWSTAHVKEWHPLICVCVVSTSGIHNTLLFEILYEFAQTNTVVTKNVY